MDASGPRSSTEPRAVVDAFMKAFAADDIDALLAICSPDIIWKTYGAPDVPWTGTGVRHGHAAVRSYIETLRQALLPLSFSTVLTLDGREGHVALFGNYTWLVRSNERRFSGDWVILFAIKDGMVAYFSMYEDTYAIAQAVLDLPGLTLAAVAAAAPTDYHSGA